jgi:deoxyribonuclease V
MVLAFDTYYYGTKAKTICLSFENWTTTESFEILAETIDVSEEYISGEFFKRELPCILSLLKKIDIKYVSVIIIDGFVYLDDDKKLGLGGHLYNSLDKKIPIIGVAKNDFVAINKLKRVTLRGKSKKPLFVTSAGIDLDFAHKRIMDLPGDFRIPDILKRLDVLTKDINYG